MIAKKATVKNRDGIHLRPAKIINEAVNKYEGKVFLKLKHQKTKELTSLVLLTSGLVKGSEIKILVEGPEEEKMARKLKSLFQKNFDFER
ncbi:MAG: HPr family phosphocarrier protein [Myxococcota bacterium]